MVDLNQSPNIENSIKAEEAANSIKQDVDGVLDMQINQIANSQNDDTGMSESDNDNTQRLEDALYVEKSRAMTSHVSNANELTTHMGDATIALLKLLNYYAVLKENYTFENLEMGISQITGIGITRQILAELAVMLMSRDFITPAYRFENPPWTITAKGRAFLILDYNLSNIGNM